MATVVIGAGIGGLAAAIALSARGEQVIVLERQAGAGGKMRPLQQGDHLFDSGPTVMTMRWVFDELLALASTQLDSLVKLRPLEILSRHYWSGGQKLDLHATASQTYDAIAAFAGRPEAEGYRRFSEAARHIHRSLVRPFLKSQRPTVWGLCKAMSFADILRLNPFETLWHATGRYFRDKRLRQMFARYATYCGTSPFGAPATLMLVADVEAEGVWRIDGGLGRLVLALEDQARKLGVVFHFNCHVQRIETTASKVTAVITTEGSRYACTAVVVNADCAAVSTGLLGAFAKTGINAPRPQDRSLSAITWCALTQETGVPLSHHTVFFSDDYEAEFVDLKNGPAKDPTVYICDQDKGRKLILINAPANGADAPEDCDTAMLRRLERCGLAMTMVPQSLVRRGPKEFAELYPATAGSLYGRASHGWMSTFQRPQARTKVPGLYLAGGSTHPGPGVPMAALSGMRAAEAILRDRASTSM